MHGRDGNSLVILIFSSLGHLLNHVCLAFYFVIVLSLEIDWGMPYHELIELWTLGALMVGVAALPSGLLGDRIGAPVMMAIYFLGLGSCSIGAGSADSSSSMLMWLTGIGIFAAIYHPVAIPWLVRTSHKAKGKVLAFNGIFGSLGGALAGLLSGWLIDFSGWRSAFIVPGVVCLLLGAALVFCINRGAIDNQGGTERAVEHDAKGRDLMMVFALLTVTMFMAGLIFYSTQTALPKLFELRNDGLVGAGTFGIGVLVAVVYTVAGFTQLVGGELADRYPLKFVYVGAILIEVPLLAVAAVSSGAVLLLIAVMMVSSNAGALPAENMLLAKYTPSNRHGLAFGAKFVLAFGAGPLAVQLVSYVQGYTGEFFWLFMMLSGFALIAFIAASFLPKTKELVTQTV